VPANGTSSEYFFNTTGGLRDLDLPGGGKVQVVDLEIEDLIQLEILDKMDMFGSLVQTEHVERVKNTGKPTDRPKKKPTKAEQAAADEAETAKFAELIKDKSKFTPLSQIIDVVTAFSVKKPTILNAYEEVLLEGGVKSSRKIPIEDREDGVFYTDNMKFEDKMHIFSSVLPSGESMASFREGSGEDVGDVASVSETPGNS
jgi:hypothetical protein